MLRNVFRLSLATGFLFMVGVAPSAADTVTFDNNPLHAGGSFSLGNTVSVSNGAIDEVARVAPIANVIQFDDNCEANPAQCTGSLTGTLAPGNDVINPILAVAVGVSPDILGGNSQTLFFSPSGISLPVDSLASAGTATADTSQLQVVTPAAATAVPEPGSLVLLGSGLLLFARVVRSRVK